MNRASIYFLVGSGMLVLGGCAGIALFLRAVTGKRGEKKEPDPAASTLWGLFVVCMVAGLILVAFH